MLRMLACSAACAVIVGSCMAPHDNPDDPVHGGTVEGRVLTRRATPIAWAQVLVPRAGRIAESDSLGRFILTRLADESLWVFVSAPGYARESTCLVPARCRVDTLVTYLNGLPYFRLHKITSHVHNRGWPPEPLLFARFDAVVSDSDGDADLDSVWAEVAELGLCERLSYDADRRLFSYVLWGDSLPGRSLEPLVGAEAVFAVADRQGAIQRVGTRVTRIIYHVPQLVFPSGGLDSLAQDTVFVWRSFAHGYPVRYHGEIVRIEQGGPGGLAGVFDTPSSVDTSLKVTASSLPRGEYYWTVEVFDEMGNSARSVEERFRVF